MSDNVIIFGAGASRDAGIPLLAEFVEKMLDFHQRGTNGTERLSKDDRAIFQSAIDVINELDGYHGRAAFDDRNIEDILSILSFDVMGGEDLQRSKWNAMIKAIARTIELTCVVKDSGIPPVRADLGLVAYTAFWARLFQKVRLGGTLPSIIDFNYDLVLERTLFQLLNGFEYSTMRRGAFPFEGISLKYHYDGVQDYAYLVQSRDYPYPNCSSPISGTALAIARPDQMKNPLEIEILKLHGSLNFPGPSRSLANASGQRLSNLDHPTNVVAEPYILPPIFNKLSMTDAAPMWRTALSRLRAARKVFIVGYSLPRTDIYMQYFFKAALGPNRDLRQIVVFNPVLFREDAEADDMKRRYGKCFSPQFQKLIEFQPRWHWMSSPISGGTFQHFSEAIERDGNLFF